MHSPPRSASACQGRHGLAARIGRRTSLRRRTEEILVIEEKRQLIEYQLKEELYNWREDVRPRVIGKFDEKGEWASTPDNRGVVSHGEWLLPAAGELSVAQIARVIASRIDRFFTSSRIQQRLALIEAKQKALAAPIVLAQRTPTFCSGCPHNTSTHVPEGSRAVAGIGCHYMVTWMDRKTSHLHAHGRRRRAVGRAGALHRGKHIFANLGDGTYFHSGLLAIRQSVAAGHPITYKILYNDAVAMTGGQPVDGTLTIPSDDAPARRRRHRQDRHRHRRPGKVRAAQRPCNAGRKADSDPPP